MHTFNLRNFSAAIAALLILVAGTARAELRIDITQPNVQPMPIAVTDFFGQQPTDAQSGMNIAGVVAADLERSGLFKPIDKKAFIQTPDSLRTLPRFGDWQVARKEDPSMLTEWQVYRMFESRRGAWATFQFLIRERLREDGVRVGPDGSVD